MSMDPSRRHFVQCLAAAAAAGLLSLPEAHAEDEKPQNTTIHLGRWDDGASCWASLYLAGELLRAEGFNVSYAQYDEHVDNTEWLARGNIDFDMNMPSMHILSLERGVPLKILTGVHFGCFQLMAQQSIQSVSDLKGKRVGVGAIGSHPHLLLSMMAKYVGLDPAKDIEWLEVQSLFERFKSGSIDAFLANRPETHKLQKANIGHVLIDNALDKPWSQYFCCMIAGRPDYIKTYPYATRRVLRAILLSADLCASNPDYAAQQLHDRGFITDLEYARETLASTRHQWRGYDAEDSVRFYALRMRELEIIKSNPEQVIANGTDWRFLEELKQELKA